MSKGSVYVGIDPGVSGGVAVLDAAGVVLKLESMPKTERDIWTLIASILPEGRPYAMIEKVGGFIAASGDGVGGARPGSAMFKFGHSYGGLRMALIAAGIPFDEVTPQKWQQGLGVQGRKTGEPSHALKNRAKAKAQQLWPTQKLTLATCDALLIAEHCRKSRVG